MEFRVGQKVELINNEDMGAELGAIATVKHIDSVYLSVIWVRDSKWRNQGDGGYRPKDFRPFIRKGEQLLFSFMGEQDG